jgi:hypothetical protein
MKGNVWEWTKGGTPTRRILRGGSFIDSLDGSFNHAVRVSTRQENTADSAGVNMGFRCASSGGIESQGAGGTASDSSKKANVDKVEFKNSGVAEKLHGKHQNINMDADHVIEL